MELMKLNGESEKLTTVKYRVKCGVNDPRGKHCVVYDTETGKAVSHTWSESDAIELSIMFESGEAECNPYTAPINEDVYKYLTPKKVG